MRVHGFDQQFSLFPDTVSGLKLAGWTVTYAMHIAQDLNNSPISRPSLTSVVVRKRHHFNKDTVPI
jgi:hypothetical protein